MAALLRLIFQVCFYYSSHCHAFVQGDLTMVKGKWGGESMHTHEQENSVLLHIQNVQ